MRDAGIGQHALDVALRNGQQVANDHRHRGQRPEDGGQVNGEGGEGGGEDAEQRRKARDLCARGHEGSYGCRRALVHVGSPHVERDGRDLETESHQDEGRPDGQEQDRGLALSGQSKGRGGSEDARQAGRPRRAEDQRDPVDDESR